MTQFTCSLSDKLLEMVTPSTFKDWTRPKSGNGDGDGGTTERLFLLSVKTISADLDRFSTKLFLSAHSPIWSISNCRLSILHAGISGVFRISQMGLQPTPSPSPSLLLSLPSFAPTHLPSQASTPPFP